MIGIAYSNDPASTPGTTFGYDRRGRLTTVARNSITTTLAYNDANQQLTESHSGGSLNNLSMNRTVDNYLRRDTVNIKNGVTVLQSATYGYNNEGSAYQYNAANQRTRLNQADGSYWVYQYDDLGQVISGKRYWSDGSPVDGQQFEYAFDTIGNRKATAGRESSQSSYTVTRLNEYVSRTVPDKVDVQGIANPTANVTVNGNVANRKGEYFHYPLTVSNGNPAYPTITVISQYGATQSDSGEVFVPASTESYYHDLDGNLTQDGRWTYTWDAENRLIQMIRDVDSPAGARQRLVFEYDWQGRRIRKQFSTYNGGFNEQSDVIYLYDGRRMLGELDANNSNARLRTYLWGSDLSGSLDGAAGVGGLLMVNNYQGTFDGKSAPTGQHFVAYDGNGNVAGLIKASDGSISARYEYGPFGEAVRVSGGLAKANPVRFSTKMTDNESGLAYYGYRYYNPALGRWLSRDPIEERGGLNYFNFVQNSPIGEKDALGLAIFLFGTCGADVTMSVNNTLDDVKKTWDQWGRKDPQKQLAACKELFDLTDDKFRSAWYITELANTGDHKDLTKNWPFKPPAKKGTGPYCEGTVVYNGKCYEGRAVQYLMFGKALGLCYTKNRWKYNIGTLDLAIAAWKGWYNLKEEAYFFDAAAFANAAFLDNYQRPGSIPKQSEKWECSIKPDNKVTEPILNWGGIQI